MHRYLFVSVLVLLLVSCSATTTGTPQGGTTPIEPSGSIKPASSDIPTDDEAPPLTSGTATETTADMGEPDRNVGSSTTQVLTSAPATTEKESSNATTTSTTTTTLLNAPESYEPNAKLDYSSAEPDA